MYRRLEVELDSIRPIDNVKILDDHYLGTKCTRIMEALNHYCKTRIKQKLTVKIRRAIPNMFNNYRNNQRLKMSEHGL